MEDTRKTQDCRRSKGCNVSIITMAIFNLDVIKGVLEVTLSMVG